MEETLLDILQSLRKVPTYTELKYRDAITGNYIGLLYIALKQQFGLDTHKNGIKEKLSINGFI